MSLFVRARAGIRTPPTGQWRAFRTATGGRWGAVAGPIADDDRERGAGKSAAGPPTWKSAGLAVGACARFSSVPSAWAAGAPPPLTGRRYDAAKTIALATRTMAGGAAGEGFRDGKPTLEYAMKLPKTFASMPHETILHLAEMGVPEACRECIVRDVMAVDQIEYDEAMKVFEKIAESNREDMVGAALAYRFGAVGATAAGFVSIPLVFDLGTVDWFNTTFVTSELPPPEDLETFLEVGAASWGWMEPVLGQVSFFLLCMQFARSQMQNLGLRPYFYWQQKRRVERLQREYPRYDQEFLALYSKSDRLSGPRKLSA